MAAATAPNKWADILRSKRGRGPAHDAVGRKLSLNLAAGSGEGGMDDADDDADLPGSVV